MENTAIVKKAFFNADTRRLHANSRRLSWQQNLRVSAFDLRKSALRSSSFIILFLFAFIITPSCFAEGNKTTLKEEVSQEIKDFNLIQYTADGKKKWELNGDTATLYGGLIEICEPKAIFYGEKSKFNLSAEKGFFNKPQNDVELKQNVVVSSSDGMRITTGYLNWEADSQKITTDAPVFATKDNLRTIGTGASCNLEEKKLKFNENVSSRIEEGTIITCEGPLELDYGKNRAAFHRGVQVKDSQGNLLADRMDVFFDPETKKIKRVIASGNVRIIHGENVTYSRVAIYLVDRQKVILPKRPKLIIAPETKDGTE